MVDTDQKSDAHCCKAREGEWWGIIPKAATQNKWPRKGIPGAELSTAILEDGA